MSLVAIVPSEEELGPQRFCVGCRSWWPLTNEYYVLRHPSWRPLRCRACLRAATEARRAARKPPARSHAPKAVAGHWASRRAYWRAAQRHHRDRNAA